jgi:hypothetical protein
MIATGNLIANHRKSDMQLLNEMVANLPPLEFRFAPHAKTTTLLTIDNDATQQHQPVEILSQPNDAPLDTNELLSEEVDVEMEPFGDEFTAEQILALANSLENEDAEWMARVIHEDCVWQNPS